MQAEQDNANATQYHPPTYIQTSGSGIQSHCSAAAVRHSKSLTAHNTKTTRTYSTYRYGYVGGEAGCLANGISAGRSFLDGCPTLSRPTYWEWGKRFPMSARLSVLYPYRYRIVLYGLAGGIIPTAEMLIDRIWLYVRVYTMRRIQAS